jgi:hypothetical protein
MSKSLSSCLKILVKNKKYSLKFKKTPMNNSNYLTVKSTITNIEAQIDKNSNPYFRVSVRWDTNDRTFYAFATDYALKSETLTELTNAPENFINRLSLITYEELENKTFNNTFCA